MDAIDRTQKQWERRIRSALTSLKPICSERLPVKARVPGLPGGDWEESPNSWKAIQQGIRGVREQLNALERLL